MGMIAGMTGAAQSIREVSAKPGSTQTEQHENDDGPT